MSDMKRYIPLNQSLDLDQILQEAQHRWLRPAEICEILRNYQIFSLTPDPPVRPPAGSLFLFDRKILRYFRKDGHRWRKKRDGKTVKEAHEKLKAGSIDVLHCYYAHGEDNENFQRRSYWMLDEKLEHIVLVHYREVKEGYKLGGSRLPNSANQGSHLSSLPCSPSLTVQESHASSSNTVDRDEQALSSDLDGKDSGGDRVPFILANSIQGSISDNTSFLAAKGFPDDSRNLVSGRIQTPSFGLAAGTSTWPDDRRPGGNLDYMHNQKLYIEQLSMTETLSHKLLGARLDTDKAVQDAASYGLSWGVDTQGVDQEYGSKQQFTNLLCPKEMASLDAVAANSDERVGIHINESGELKKLDSFGRWMDKEIGRDCDDSLMASDSANYWNALDAENVDKEVSSLSRHMQLDTDSLCPSLSQEQLFSISEFAPDWAYSGIETKVLIIGRFLGDLHSGGYKWCCMFGEIEVSAEVLVDSVIRCQVPFHASGRVPFYITCSNRVACSEIREFEFRESPSGVLPSVGIRNTPEDEVLLQIRLAKILNISSDWKWLHCTDIQCDKCKLKDEMHTMKADAKSAWDRYKDVLALINGNPIGHRDVLIENLLRDRLYDWLLCKAHEGGKGPHILDDQGQAVIHLAAALGYVWALRPIVAAGVSPNFRDAQGRTALHWASYYGREETVIALVRLNSAAGAVDDPTPAYPGGRTAADVASSRGHKGIAGYLAEADLISHLHALNIRQDDMGSLTATFVADKALETAVQEVSPLHRAIDKEVALKGSLAAVRKSAHAAALIQAAFRARSFHQRQLANANNKNADFEVSTDLVTLGSLNKVQKISHFEDYLHSAAIRIQQKYRGWKGRKEFLKIRDRIVKIQAHVRGHQVRKQYKKVVWSVGIVEKAILRWRRKKPGLRGFRAGKACDGAIAELEKNDEYEFLRIGQKQKFAGVEKALARVQSMVRHPEARDQYMRLVTKFENCQLNDEGSKES